MTKTGEQEYDDDVLMCWMDGRDTEVSRRGLRRERHRGPGDRVAASVVKSVFGPVKGHGLLFTLCTLPVSGLARSSLADKGRSSLALCTAFCHTCLACDIPLHLWPLPHTYLLPNLPPASFIHSSVHSPFAIHPLRFWKLAVLPG